VETRTRSANPPSEFTSKSNATESLSLVVSRSAAYPLPEGIGFGVQIPSLRSSGEPSGEPSAEPISARIRLDSEYQGTAWELSGLSIGRSLVSVNATGSHIGLANLPWAL